VTKQDIGFVTPGSKHDVAVSIVVEITCLADGPAELIARRCTGDAEALAAGEECQIDVREGGGGAVAEDHVHCPSIRSLSRRSVVLIGTHD
jgi:hypothetical protein